MNLHKSQLFALLGFLLLSILLLSLRTKPRDLIDREKTRSLNLQSTDINILRQEAAGRLSDNAKARIQILEAQLADAEDEEKTEIYKDLSSIWYDAEEIGISGHYAEEVAHGLQSASAWGIAGTTYALCIKRTEKEKERSLCLSKALESLENAISLDPDNLSYQINRAVLLAENPPQDNPMRGVLLLLEMNKKFPENVPVINNIAKFALQTNQLDKAEQRLLGALEIDPNNIKTNCLLAQLYEAKGDKRKASNYLMKCK